LMECQVAVKFEWTKAEKGRRLLAEAQLCQTLAPGGPTLKQHASRVCVPAVHAWGTEQDYNFMAMELCGPSLEDLFVSCGRKFSLKTVLMLGLQMVDCMEYVHSLGILHRDIKPNNFLIGVSGSSRVFIVDFGLAKRYRDEKGEHIPSCKKKGLTGTVRYTSQNVHQGLEPSRRDDLGAIGYVLMYFNRGRLPWQGINASSKKTKQRRIGRKKARTSHDELCKGFPREFVKYLEYCDALGYTEEPDYEYLRSLLRDVSVRENIQLDKRFDWMLSEADRKAQVQAGMKRARVVDATLAGAPEKCRSRSPKGKNGAVVELKEGAEMLEPLETEYYDEYEYGEEEEEESEEDENEESEEEDKEESAGEEPKMQKA